jgi:hypothetical protein
MQENDDDELKLPDEDLILAKQSSSQSPKTFIRIRRISGDKLSKGSDQEISAINGM